MNFVSTCVFFDTGIVYSQDSILSESTDFCLSYSHIVTWFKPWTSWIFNWASFEARSVLAVTEREVYPLFCGDTSTFHTLSHGLIVPNLQWMASHRRVLYIYGSIGLAWARWSGPQSYDHESCISGQITRHSQVDTGFNLHGAMDFVNFG